VLVRKRNTGLDAFREESRRGKKRITQREKKGREKKKRERRRHKKEKERESKAHPPSCAHLIPEPL
jgi:NADPH-dependent glutamate synthase beta subunit-like oxidoreductase